jgi:hypothetical protein
MPDIFPFSLSDLQAHFGAALYPASFVQRDEDAFWLMRAGNDKRLALLARPDNPLLAAFHGEHQEFRDGYTLHLCPADHANAHALRMALSWLQPVPLGLTTSAGFGDRLGLATPGHVRALQKVVAASAAPPVAPIFAQQSIREMARTGRTPDDVLSDATWGTFEAGGRGPLGADADHLKTLADIDACAAAGFSLYTFDPGAQVDSTAGTVSPVEIQQKIGALPWPDLNSSPDDLRERFIGRTVDLGNGSIQLTDEVVLRAAAKYGRAVAHVAKLYRHLESKGVPFEVEVSVDETETPTTHAEHNYVACELQRLGVHWVSLAPRYVGRFEKGVEYIGDLDALRADLAGHAAIARALGPYKLSLHSGSDKFSVYPLIADATRGMVHLKTAGTSYLEGLRTIARVNPALFREIAALALKRYAIDRATYHVSADTTRVPVLSKLADDALAGLLDQFEARQILHVTFGSALAKFGADIKASLRAHEEEHYAMLERRFVKHLEPFVRQGSTT